MFTKKLNFVFTSLFWSVRTSIHRRTATRRSGHKIYKCILYAIAITVRYKFQCSETYLGALRAISHCGFEEHARNAAAGDGGMHRHSSGRCGMPVDIRGIIRNFPQQCALASVKSSSMLSPPLAPP